MWVKLSNNMVASRYISYAPSFVTRKLGGMQYALRSQGLIDFINLFRHQSSLKEIELIR